MSAPDGPSLQEQFLRSGGRPVVIAGRTIVQMDRIGIPDTAQITIRFVSKAICEGNAVVVALPKPGRIFLSDGTAVQALKIWDDPALPREVTYKVEASGQLLQVYNKYRTRHGPDFVTEDNFTGNAGMIVTDLQPDCRLYECSNGPGKFSPSDLVFEITWRALID